MVKRSFFNQYMYVMIKLCCYFWLDRQNNMNTKVNVEKYFQFCDKNQASICITLHPHDNKKKAAKKPFPKNMKQFLLPVILLVCRARTFLLQNNMGRIYLTLSNVIFLTRLFLYCKWSACLIQATCIEMYFNSFHQQQRSNSKLSDKYHAGRGRALKELSRRSPKAEVSKLKLINK